MKVPGFLLLALIGTCSAQTDAVFNQSAQLILNAVSQGRSVQGFAGAGPFSYQAIAVPYRRAGDECISIGLIRVATLSIQNWRLCRGRLEQLPMRSPSLLPTTDPRIAAVVAQAEQAAANSGGERVEWGDYEILARRLTEPDANDCPRVESIILIDGLLLSRQVSSQCR